MGDKRKELSAEEEEKLLAENENEMTRNPQLQLDTDGTLSISCQVTSDNGTPSTAAPAVAAPPLFTLEQVQALLSSIPSSSTTPPVPNLTVRVFRDNELLTTKGGFRRWDEMLRLELATCDRVGFIQEAFAAVSLPHVPERQRRIMDSGVLQLIRAATSRHIWNYVNKSESAFDAYTTIQDLFRVSETKDMISLYRKWERLHFRTGFNQLIYVTRFESLLSEFKEHDCTFSNEYCRVAFLAKIHGIEEIDSPLSTYYRNANGLPRENRTFETTKEMFLDIDLTKFGKPRTNFNDNVSVNSVTCNFSNIEARHSADDVSRVDNDDININVCRIETTSKRRSMNDGKPKFDKKPRHDKPDQVSSLTKPKKKSVTEKYTQEQMAQIASWTLEEKRKNRCSKCSEYFHTAETCPNPGQLCFKCYRYGHFAKNCRSQSEYEFLVTDFSIVLTILVDSAASHHVTYNRTFLLHFKGHSVPREVNTYNPDDKNTSLGEGSLVLLLENKGRYTVVCLRGVQYVPGGNKTLISVGAFNAQFKTSFKLNTNTGVICYRTERQAMTRLTIENRIYRFQAKISNKPVYGEYFQKSSSRNTPLSINCTQLTEDSFEFGDSNLDIPKQVLTRFSKTDANKYSRVKRSKARRKLTPAQREKLLELGRIWHERMAHVCAPYVNRLSFVTDGVDNLILNETRQSCEVCALSKMIHKPFNKTREQATRIGEIVHADLIGEITPTSTYKNKKYILQVIDDYSRYMFVHPMRSKVETSSKLDLTLREIQAQNPGLGNLNLLNSDRGSEFTCKATRDVLAKYGMTPRYAEPNCHQHNGMAERANLTLEQRTRALLISSGLPSRLWNFAAKTAAYLYNRTPHSSLGFVTPYEIFYGRKPNLKHIRIFGSRAFTLNEKIPRGKKVEPRATRQYLVGYTPTGYITCNPTRPVPQFSCNVVINEKYKFKDDSDKSRDIEQEELVFNYPVLEDVTMGGREIGNVDSIASEGDIHTVPSTSIEYDSDHEIDEVVTVEIDDDWDQEISTDDPPVPPIELNTVSFNLENNTKMFDMYGSYNKDVHVFDDLPLTYDQATRGPEANEWKVPIAAELEALHLHQVWEIIPKEKFMKPIPVKWIFSKKDSGKRKARLVAVGCRDPEVGLYTSEEKASPTPSATVIRWIFALAVHRGWNLQQFDVTNAFLHSPIDREKYIQIPPGNTHDPKKFVCKLNKALYGLTTAPVCWYKLFSSKMESFGFVMSPRELCVFRKINKQDPTRIQVCLNYVDDILLTGNDIDGISETIRFLENNFQIRKLGFPSKFVGLQIERIPDHGLHIHLENYVNKIVATYRLDSAPAFPTPIIPITNHKIKPSDDEANFPYKQALGHVQFAANYARPDIAFAVGFLARYQSNPQPIHWVLMKHLIRYLKGTPRLGLVYKRKNASQFYVFADADHAAEKERRSTTGYLISYHGNLVSWCSRLQRSIANSSQEAEYRAINEATFELLFIARLTEELIENVDYPITIREDNISTIAQCSQFSNKGRIKHVELAYFLIRQNIKRNIIRVEQVSSENNLADVLTKPLTTATFRKLCGQILNDGQNTQ